MVVATDRGSRTLEIVDADAKKIVTSVTLAGAPDYVRFVPSTRQVWVTEPGKKEIEVLALVPATDGKDPIGLSHAGTIAVPGGPESLVVDTARGRAYTHTWKDQSYAIDLQSRRIVASWTNGCQRARGMALDSQRGFLFAGCAEGRATVVDVTSGKLLAVATTGTDVDSVAYSATLGHLYVPGGGTGDLSIFAVSGTGTLVLLGKASTAADAHTAAFDPVTGTVFVGDPGHGAILAIPDPFPSSL
jgi:DNA-binding beta-propeller fold protein YncE